MLGTTFAALAVVFAKRAHIHALAVYSGRRVPLCRPENKLRKAILRMASGQWRMRRDRIEPSLADGCQLRLQFPAMPARHRAPFRTW